MPDPNSQEATQQVTQQVTNEVTQSEQAAEQPATEQQSAESQVQEAPKVEAAPAPKRTHNDRIAELESKIAKMEALYQLQGQNVVDMEVCTDLLLKGYTLDQLKQSKPYLFGQPVQTNTGVVKQPPKVVTETQTPRMPTAPVSSDGFVKALANMLTSKF